MQVAGSSPGRRVSFLWVAKEKIPKATLVPARPGLATPAVLGPDGVSSNKLRSNRREPKSTQLCTPWHLHKGTRILVPLRDTPRLRRR